MNKTIIAGASLAAFLSVGLPALAADLPGSYAPASPYAPPGLPPVFTWSGIYVGVNVGGAFGDRTIVSRSTDGGAAANAAAAADRVAGIGIQADDPVGPASASTVSKASAGGVIGGAQVGYNHQFAGTGFVAGIETEFDGSSFHASASSNSTSFLPLADGKGGVVNNPVSSGLGIGQRLEYSGNVRGRLGYAYDRALIFGTGGFAYGRVVDSAYAFNGAGGGYEQFGTVRTGYVVGGGVEYMLTNSVSIKGEYLYTDLGRSHSSYVDPVSGLATINTVNNDFQQVRVGMNYKFGGGAGLLGAIPGLSGIGF